MEAVLLGMVASQTVATSVGNERKATKEAEVQKQQAQQAQQQQRIAAEQAKQDAITRRREEEAAAAAANEQRIRRKGGRGGLLTFTDTGSTGVTGGLSTALGGGQRP